MSEYLRNLQAESNRQTAIAEAFNLQEEVVDLLNRHGKLKNGNVSLRCPVKLDGAVREVTLSSENLPSQSDDIRVSEIGSGFVLKLTGEEPQIIIFKGAPTTAGLRDVRYYSQRVHKVAQQFS